MSLLVCIAIAWLALAVLGLSLLVTAARGDRRSVGRPPAPPPLWRWPRR